MLEEDVPEWRIEEMRAQERSGGRCRPGARKGARRGEEAARAARRARGREARRGRARRARRERKRASSPRSRSITDETLTQMVAEQVRDSLRLSRASVPVAIPVADDGRSRAVIPRAAVAEGGRDDELGTKAQARRLSGFRGFRGFRIRRARRRAARRARTPARTPPRARRRGGASWSATPRSPVPPARRAGGWAPGAPRRADVSKGRSPVVYGTKSFDALWLARAGAPGSRARRSERRGRGMRVLSAVRRRRGGPERRRPRRRPLNVATTRRTEARAQVSHGSFDSDADPYERHSASPSPARDAKRITSTRSREELQTSARIS